MAVEANRAALLVQPTNDGHYLIQRRRIPSLGRKRVVDTDHRHSASVRKFAHHSIVRIDTEQRPAAAVHVNKRRLAVTWRRIVDTQLDGPGRSLSDSVTSVGD